MLKIGICDDKIQVHYQVKKYISEEIAGVDIEWHSFLSGTELMEYKGNLDVLFLDILMPGMDGIEAGRLLRRRGNVGKIIMLTGIFNLILGLALWEGVI